MRTVGGVCCTTFTVVRVVMSINGTVSVAVVLVDRDRTLANVLSTVQCFILLMELLF